MMTTLDAHQGNKIDDHVGTIVATLVIRRNMQVSGRVTVLQTDGPHGLWHRLE